MSTDYCLQRRVKLSDLLEGLQVRGVHEHPSDDTSQTSKCLTDGHNNYLWVHCDKDGWVTYLTRFAPNGNPTKILRTIVDTFDMEIYTEHEPEFWGFETQEDWDAAMDNIAEENENKFYDDLKKFLAGEDSNIQQGTVGWGWAEIAANLVRNDPSLLEPEQKMKLMQMIYETDRRENAVMIQVHEDELMAHPFFANTRDEGQE